MKRLVTLSLLLVMWRMAFSQCNLGLNLGAVIVPTHSDSANNGNFTNPAAWQEAAGWVDSLKLDFRQPYYGWADIVSQINNGTPVFKSDAIAFENQLSAWAGHPAVHIVYTTTKVGVANTLADVPPGFGPFTSFLDTAYINQNYLAIKYLVQNIAQVKWISIGNEIDAYFGGAYLSTGRLGQYAVFLDTMRNRLHRDFPNVKVGTIFAFHNLVWNNGAALVDSIRQSVDFIGYTFYYTTTAAQDCWADPATVSAWLDAARTTAGNRPLFITETSMGDGGGIAQNCGSPAKQQAYADTLLRWYNTHASAVEGMTWFTITDPYIGWLISNTFTLWNTCGLVDSSGAFVQPAGTLWNHKCPASVSDVPLISSKGPFDLVVDPSSHRLTIHQPENRPQETRLSVYRISGSPVTQACFHQDRYILNTNDYPNGIYFLKIENSDRKVVRKIILTK
jgi:hypothetical protein